MALLSFFFLHMHLSLLFSGPGHLSVSGVEAQAPVAIESLTSRVNTSFLTYVAEPDFQASSLFCVVGAERGEGDDLLPHG